MQIKKTIHQHKTGRPKGKSKASTVPRITYATLTITPADDKAYDQAIERVRAQLGKHFSNYINGNTWRTTGQEMAHASPLAVCRSGIVRRPLSD